jgi:hypothetical protein
MVVEVAFGSVRVAHYERRTAPLEVSNIRPPCIDKQASELLRISGRCHIAEEMMSFGMRFLYLSNPPTDWFGHAHRGSVGSWPFQRRSQG